MASSLSQHPWTPLCTHLYDQPHQVAHQGDLEVADGFLHVTLVLLLKMPALVFQAGTAENVSLS